METDAQFWAEVKGYLVIFVGIYVVGIGHMIRRDIQEWRNGTRRTAAQRHTRSHHKP
jgi:hypothetical protein